MHQLKHNKTHHKTHFILGTNCHMLRHVGGIFRTFINNKGASDQHVLQVLVVLTFIIKTKVSEFLKF